MKGKQSQPEEKPFLTSFSYAAVPFARRKLLRSCEPADWITNMVYDTSGDRIKSSEPPKGRDRVEEDPE